MTLKTFVNPAELACGAAEHFVAQSVKAVAKRGSFSVALSGGSTPKRLYQLLADANESFHDRVPWSSIHFFWSDERHVAPDHPDNNYRMANEILLSRVPVSPNNVHRIQSETPNAEEAAAAYEKIIREVCGPRLDLILLGLGADGHTASIFPGSEVLHETRRLLAASYVEKLKSYRITMTLPLLNNARSILFLVSGSEKADIVKEVFQGPSNLYPAQRVRPNHGELLWMLDNDAASRLNSQVQATR
jgi:6-phosphogluconolactonase